ncbi:hypothetical protein [Phenylobacterium montanum]|uniref:Uncharacterized protein n=1 Tax=Phenylobacterium montanum TaxID=2823693 RepID=A0A975IWP9_9CAUL|nr:hypothetical protein [Caulobacter sp. S6]QUD89819.1 hypothetical protein KCG34_08100 [Caulobacter sp. S6]
MQSRLDDAAQLALDLFPVRLAMNSPRKTDALQTGDEQIAIDLALGLLSEDDVKAIERRVRAEPIFARSLRLRLGRLAEMGRAFGDARPSSTLWDRIAAIIARLDQQS